RTDSLCVGESLTLPPTPGHASHQGQRPVEQLPRGPIDPARIGERGTHFQESARQLTTLLRPRLREQTERRRRESRRRATARKLPTHFRDLSRPLRARPAPRPFPHPDV